MISAVDLDDVVALTQEIVRIPSVCGEEAEISDALTERMRGMGYDEVYQQEALPGRKNVVGVVDSGRPGPTIVLTGHIDTKPVCVGWDEDPYCGRLDGDRLYGHAVMDMKAGIGGVVAAGDALSRIRDQWRGKVIVSGVVDHMGDQIGAIKFFEEHQGDYCLLAELTDNDIYLGHRGRLYWDVTCYGKAAHTCRRHDAINSIALAVPVIEEVEKLRWEPEVPSWITDLVGPELYTAVGRIYGGLPPGGPSMIPDETVMRIDSRPHPGIDAEQVREYLQAAIDRAAARRPDGRYEMVLADRKDSYLIERDHPLVEALDAAFQQVAGREPRYAAGSWLADTASFGKQIPTVIFGPGHDPVYTPNEWLDVADIKEAAQVNTVMTVLLSNQED
ncbi:MAG: M20/M25/M40 family metallo-hydrolase [Actinobacteria bacterium]|nr:M20/M25/M40 family metallo-hydrolase [Actinomycetota bacterium]